jgi:signal transduction histidine kinase
MSRVLVVEDSPTQAAQLEMILAGAGFAVEIARDGQEGCERCAAARFDLVLSDVLMPRLTGFELCRKLKADPATCDVPVILLTTLADPADIIEALACGAENFINKPYDAEYLLGRVDRVLASARMRAGRPPSAEAEILFLGERITIGSPKEQILDLLVSSLEDSIRANRKLQASQAAVENADREIRAQHEQLVRVNKELEAFAYTVSHDLKEPLRGIEALSGLLLEDCAPALDEQGSRYLHLVRDSALRMRQLIDDLLAFSRVGRHGTSAVRVDLRAVVTGVLATLRFSLDEAGATVALPPDAAAAVGYPTLLQQLFANLLGNALKYRRPAVAPCITIAWRALDDGAVEVAVADDGIGVPSEHREWVFGLFQRLHRREEFPGTGVGLAICKRIVEEHDGTIGLEETPGGGCTVRFTLRRSDVAARPVCFSG